MMQADMSEIETEVMVQRREGGVNGAILAISGLRLGLRAAS